MRQEDVDTLCGMFTQVDRAVVEIVLESSGQNLDRAIDQLLEMTSEQAESVQTAQESEVAVEEEGGEGEAETEAEDSRTWRKKIPDDFLRLPSQVKLRLEDSSQIEHDSMIAQLLANESFRQELSQHEEFRHTLGQQGRDGGDWASVFEGLGEAARTKLSALATRFNSRSEYARVNDREDEQYWNAMMPSNGNFARNRRRQNDGEEEDGLQMEEVSSFSRMKLN